MAKKTYKIKGMDCDACAKMIELDLEDAGITARCDYSKSLLEVEIKKNEDEKKIKKILKESGYSIVAEN